MSIAPFAISLGDPAGIGPEIVAKAWEHRHVRALPCFFAVGDAAALAAVWDGPVVRIEEPARAAEAFNGALPCLHIDDGGPVIPGQPSYEGARTALQSLERSEEHTSELQSLMRISYAVFCLKKKNIITNERT